jgi:presenilin-like A22 family membrane protease
MKHELKVTLFLIALFALAQVAGLVIMKSSLKQGVDSKGNLVTVFDEQKVGEIPQISGLGFLLYVAFGIGVGTVLVLILVRFRKANLWRAWFFFAVLVAIDFALRTFLPEWLSLIIAFILAAWKIMKPNVIVHNLSEILMYSGIAVFLVSLLNNAPDSSTTLFLPTRIFWATLLLIIISIYDFIAVFKSRHMVSMAKFQTDSKVFAGLFIPYKVKGEQKIIYGRHVQEKKVQAPQAPARKRTEKLPGLEPSGENKSAILGGGDIAFPLIFSGTVLYHLSNSLLPAVALGETFIITATTTAALALLFFYAKKDKFYPAMPILSAGCFVGYAIILLL